MKRRFLWLLGCMFFLMLSVLVLSFTAPDTADNFHTIRLQSPAGEMLSLDVELATTLEQQKTGLMYRPQVRHGMLFSFPKAQPQNFWMKNTLVPLDILFFDENNTYVSATTMQPCTDDPCPLYASEGLAQYALEMPKGFVQNNSIGKDWKIVP